MVLVMRVTIPAGVGPGQKVNFQTPDGRTASVVVPFGVLPGQMMNVNVPDPMPYPGGSKRGRERKQLKLPKLKGKGDDSDDDDDDSESDSDESDSGSMDGGEYSIARSTNRPRRDSSNKALGRFSSMVDDKDFEYSIKEQERLLAEKKTLDKKAKKERAAKLAAQAEVARIKAEAAAAALAAEDLADENARNNDDEYTIDSIQAVKRGPNGLVFWIKWKGFDKSEDNTWEPEESLHGELVHDFKRDHPHEVHEATHGEIEIEIAGENSSDDDDEDHLS